MSFSKVLIANRGEIAVRVINTAKQFGYRTVAVYSEADSDSLHVKLADQAVCIGPAAASESYLCIEKILAAARASGAEAIHPGYGFLSENASFAQACVDAGLEFIGPSPEAIELMGSKRLAKQAMLEAGVPCVPGYQGADQDDAKLQQEAAAIGYPLMIKASAGGGGRGMRLVHEESQLLEQISTARSEATNAFGSGELILEKAIIEPRHVEIQIFADKQGNVVYLGERDCSVQRRHQKVVEEAPSPAVNQDLRSRMGEAAVQAVKACNASGRPYVGAGTVEFLLDASGEFYFLEMNTRLQVEHPVTELVAGVDLVSWQLDVAAGKPLPLSQDEITLDGHAIEVRIYAEDPAEAFMPQTGTVCLWATSEAEGVRFDSGIATGQTVSSHYDPMVAKVIASGRDREEARRRLVWGLEQTSLLGLKNNRSWLASILEHSAFINGHATTAFLEQHDIRAETVSEKEWALAAVMLFRQLFRQQGCSNDLQGWRSSGQSSWECRLSRDDEERRIQVTAGVNSVYQVLVAESVIELQVLAEDQSRLVYVADNVRDSVRFSSDDKTLWLSCPSGDFAFKDRTLEPAQASAGSGSGQIRASMDGLIIDVLVQEGEPVTRGQTIMVLEAMKMEHQLKADCDGVLAKLEAISGTQVRTRQVLAMIEPEAA